MATEVLFANNAITTLALGISDTDTTLVVTEGTGVLFPDAVTGVSHFYVTLIDTAGFMEIVKVTNRSNDTMTIVRGVENFTPRMFPIDSVVRVNTTTQGLYDLKQEAIDIANDALAIAQAAQDDVDTLETIPRTISLTGDATGGPISFTNTQNISIPVTITGLDDGKIFNRQIKTVTGSMTMPTSTLLRIKGCGGGGSGGGTLGCGGQQGLNTTVTLNSNLIFTATGGSGGGAGSPDTNGSSGAGGGGGAGKVGDLQVYVNSGDTLVWTIGAGGQATASASTPTGPEAGRSGTTRLMGGSGAVGAGSGGTGSVYSSYNSSWSYVMGGSGGSGGVNGLGFGGGGGGAGGCGGSSASWGIGGRGGEGGANGMDGSNTNSIRMGGNGGSGVVILEWISKA